MNTPFIPEHIGTSTNRYTKPLVLKIFLAFAVMVGILLILTLFALINLGRGKDASRNALNAQVYASTMQRLRESVVSERYSVLNLLYTGIADPQLLDYQREFNDEINELNVHGVDTFALLTAHNDLKRLYDELTKAENEGRPAQARALWQIANAQADSLLKNIDTRLEAANSVALQTVKTSDLVQEESSSATLLVAFIALLVIGLVLVFVLATIVGPLRALNNQLTRLLWNQTEHLTDRLNMLQAEINTNNDMMTTVRHDLKAPLSSIKGLAELSVILQPDLDRDVKENLDKIVTMADHSVSTISEILARREQKLELETVNLEALVDKVLRLVDLSLYSVQRKVEAEEWILDKTLMEHALLNLISNARKFAASGVGVGVRKTRKAGTVNEEELELWVWNDGAIISHGDRQEIFKPGKQTEEGKKVGGHGLGLSIVKSIAERHHGRVIVDSHEKIGTTFRIFIPEQEMTVKPATPQPATLEQLDAVPELLKN